MQTIRGAVFRNFTVLSYFCMVMKNKKEYFKILQLLNKQKKKRKEKSIMKKLETFQKIGMQSVGVKF